MEVKQINPKILQDLAKLKPNAYQYILKIYPQSYKWFSGEDYPSYNQLVDISRIFNVPFGYFFLSELPKYILPIDVDFTPSEELIDAIKFAERIQDWVKDILIELGYEKEEIIGIYDDINSKLNELFNIEEAKNVKTKNELFKYLINRVEDRNIVVLVSGYIRDVSNNYRRLNCEEFKGFVMYDNIAPVIFINDNNTLSSKIHTLINAVIYVLIGESIILNKYSKDKLKDICGTDILSFTQYLPEDPFSSQKSFEIQFSEKFLNLLRTAIYNGIISYRDALIITGLKSL